LQFATSAFDLRPKSGGVVKVAGTGMQQLAEKGGGGPLPHGHGSVADCEIVGMLLSGAHERAQQA
jgi:hypothetical protein